MVQKKGELLGENMKETRCAMIHDEKFLVRLLCEKWTEIM